ncbi:hypothetical protein [Chitinibacter tainanensis]|uniref:hypothetical protein n=1 Tax=Chitinibacter tainanensis TaxID=230667 RepID=UPI00041669F1|nr:hypothetical protein [Chitinibacter tainanensis]
MEKTVLEKNSLLLRLAPTLSIVLNPSVGFGLIAAFRFTQAQAISGAVFLLLGGFYLAISIAALVYFGFSWLLVFVLNAFGSLFVRFQVNSIILGEQAFTEWTFARRCVGAVFVGVFGLFFLLIGLHLYKS